MLVQRLLLLLTSNFFRGLFFWAGWRLTFPGGFCCRDFFLSWGGSCGQVSGGMLILRSGGCWRWRVWYVISGLTRNLWKVGEGGGVQTLSQAQGDQLAVQSVGLRLQGMSVKDSRCVFAKALCRLQIIVC